MSLLDLPSEIRRIIFDIVAEQSEVALLPGPRRLSPSHDPPLGLFLACRTIGAEAQHAWYSKPFSLEVQRRRIWLYFKFWLQRIGSRNRQSLRRVSLSTDFTKRVSVHNGCEYVFPMTRSEQPHDPTATDGTGYQRIPFHPDILKYIQPTPRGTLTFIDPAMKDCFDLISGPLQLELEQTDILGDNDIREMELVLPIFDYTRQKGISIVWSGAYNTLDLAADLKDLYQRGWRVLELNKRPSHYGFNGTMRLQYCGLTDIYRV